MAEATGGKLSIKVYPNASLLPVSVIKRAVQMGRMQIGETLISLHDNEDPIFGIDVVPFLATTWSLRAVRRSAVLRRGRAPTSVISTCRMGMSAFTESLGG